MVRGIRALSSRSPWWRLIALVAGLVVSAASAFAQGPAAGAQPNQAPIGARQWLPLAKDGIHDPTNPGLSRLQEPGQALSRLAPDSAGNQVRWVQALEQGQIEPRANIRPGTKVEVKDGDILLNLRGGTPIVRFPHRQHTLWLDCSNCHDHLFKAKAGENRFSMMAILQGEQCGVCHGAVAFPLTECNRCHSVPRRASSALPSR